jgi:hypothetical protein
MHHHRRRWRAHDQARGWLWSGTAVAEVRGEVPALRLVEAAVDVEAPQLPSPRQRDRQVRRVLATTKPDEIDGARGEVTLGLVGPLGRRRPRPGAEDPREAI